MGRWIKRHSPSERDGAKPKRTVEKVIGAQELAVLESLARGQRELAERVDRIAENVERVVERLDRLSPSMAKAEPPQASAPEPAAPSSSGLAPRHLRRKSDVREFDKLGGAEISLLEIDSQGDVKVVQPSSSAG